MLLCSYLLLTTSRCTSGFLYFHISQCFEFRDYMQHQFPGDSMYWSCSTHELIYTEQYAADTTCHFPLLPAAIRAAAILCFIMKLMRICTKYKLINPIAPVAVQSGVNWLSVCFLMASQYWKRISKLFVLHKATSVPIQFFF